MKTTKRKTTRKPTLTVREIERIFAITQPCPTKSAMFLAEVKKVGFHRAYVKIVRKAWETYYNCDAWNRYDLVVPIEDVLRAAGSDIGYVTIGGEVEDFLEKWTPDRMIELGKKILKSEKAAA